MTVSASVAVLSIALCAADQAGQGGTTAPAAAPDPREPLPKQVSGGVEKVMTDALSPFTVASSSHTPELDAMVDAFPVYAPGVRRWTGSLRIVGSSTMAPLLNNLAISFESIHEELDVVVRQGGSSVGIAELCAGRANAAAESRSLRPEERQRIEQATGRKVIEVPIALDGVCVYVHAENPVPSLTSAQCNGIFSMVHSRTPGPIFRWSQVDAASPLKDEFMPIYVLNERSGTMQAFRDWCMPGEPLTTAMRFVEPGPSSVVNACCAYPTAMGIAGFANAQPRARAVPIVPDSGGPAVAPGVGSIRDGSYPLWRSMCLVFLADASGAAPPELADLCRFALSEVGQDLVTSLGCVPPHLDRVPAEIGSVAGDAWTVPTAPQAPAPAAAPRR
jgi:phosphate transport system substrate-binding protein